MTLKRINFGCWNYDRMAPIIDGRIRPEGIDINFLSMPVEETFFRMLRHREFDASEMSLSSYVLSLSQPETHFVAMPVFPSRFFRHGSIYVNVDSGIKKPEDLSGKRIGCPEYQMTAPVWIRGILSDEYGVAPWSVTYFTGGEEQPNRTEKLKLSLPNKFDVRPIGPDKTLSAMLRDGEIDALYTARMPSSYDPSGRVRRLFEDFQTAEVDFFRRTSIFPIMHTVAIHRPVYEADRWIAQSLLKAFTVAKEIALEAVSETAAMKVSLPWAIAHYEEAVALMGKDYWSYGFKPNRHVIATFLRYSFEQGLSPRLYEPEELFAPETLESYVI